MPRWTVYGRADCGLCEEMLSDLCNALGSQAASEILVLDVDADPDTQRKYGQRVPVLLADGEFVCAYRLDEDRMKPYLAPDR
jgi:hypothetical protein